MDGREFTDTFIPLGARFYEVAFGILGSESDSKDAVQELYVKLWNSRDALDSVRNPEAYGVTLVKNICIDMTRRSSVTMRSEMPESLPSREDGPDRREDLSRVIKAAMGLPEGERKVFMLRAVEGRSYEEISKITGMSGLTLRVLLSRARKKLKNAYDNE